VYTRDCTCACACTLCVCMCARAFACVRVRLFVRMHVCVCVYLGVVYTRRMIQIRSKAHAQFRLEVQKCTSMYIC